MIRRLGFIGATPSYQRQCSLFVQSYPLFSISVLVFSAVLLSVCQYFCRHFPCACPFGLVNLFRTSCRSLGKVKLLEGGDLSVAFCSVFGLHPASKLSIPISWLSHFLIGAELFHAGVQQSGSIRTQTWGSDDSRTLGLHISAYASMSEKFAR